MSTKTDLELAALIGLAAGMRTTAPVVAMAADPRNAWYALGGELCVDKLPFTPARTQAGGLLGRFVTAAGAGLDLASQRGSSLLQAALVAGVTAMIATNVIYEARRSLGKALRVPDAAIAVGEDICVLRLILYIRTTRGASPCR